MELTFEKIPQACLRQVVRGVRKEELTQEVRLPEAMPDIGRVLCTWGQVLLRGKEWHSGDMSVSGGVMAWTLYAPEGGGECQVVESWLPFQMRWEYPQTERDGTVCVSCLLRSMDSRSVSARKLMLRCGLSVLAEAWEPTRVELSQPREVPEDVLLLKRRYPMLLPMEAGEKPFALEEELTLPAAPALKTILYYNLQPETAEQKVMGDKVVFRGEARLHLLYAGEDGSLNTWDSSFPFSQYSELSAAYSPGAEARIVPQVTSLELEQTEPGNLHLKAGLTGQYVVYDRQNVETVEDAYSPRRSVQIVGGNVNLPAVLEMKKDTVRFAQTVEAEGEIGDVWFCAEHPELRIGGGEAKSELTGWFQILCTDAQGAWQGVTARCTQDWTFPCGDCQINAWAQPGSPRAAAGGSGGEARCDVTLDISNLSGDGIPMVTGLELGELMPPDPGRPSLILKRAGQQGLWELAKELGSTEEAIRQSNGLEGEPQPGQMLLIPIL